MPAVLKHLFLVAVAVPAAFVGYHAVFGLPSADGEVDAAARSFVDAVNGFALGGGYDLSDLGVLQHDLLYVEQRYVEKDRIDPEAMFDAALDTVERSVNEVMFVREPRGRRLQVSVGAWSTVLLVDPIDSLDTLASQLQRVAAVLEDHLSPGVDRPAVEYALVNGALSTLDPHSILLPPAAAREMDVDNQGEFGGLGIEILVRDGRLLVKQPLEGTPASRAGLKADDHIVRIEDESTINMEINDAVEKLRGEVGTPVTIQVKRRQFSTPRPFTIIRDVIRVNPPEGELLEGNIGYVRIVEFNAGVSSGLDDLLSRFHREARGELRGVVLDLRSNPGGYLNQAVEVSNRFLSEGVIVSTVEGAGLRRDEQNATRTGTEPDYPIAVLVNGSSASASEIVAGALRNQDRAIIVGERTFGKGSVQHLYNNKDGSKLKLTVAKYLTPGDHSIQSVGIPPDVLLEPSVVRPAKEADEDDNPVVSLFWRQWIDREADLDRHLESAPDRDARPSYSVRYLRPEQEDDEAEAADPKRDREVAIAREILLAAPSARRADVLQAARPVVDKHAAEQAVLVDRAFRRVGIDWTAPPGPQARPALDVRVDLGADGVLRAGEPEDVVVEVTNLGQEPVWQLAAVSESDNAWLNHREFYFGRIDPGQSRRYAQHVELHDGYAAEVAPVKLAFRAGGAEEGPSVERMVRTEGRPLPAFGYTLRLVDDGTGASRGDGDGLPEVGEVVDLEITVTNIGAGPSGEAFARVKNRNGRALDLSHGSVALGTPRTASGAPCDPEATGCSRSLAPGESSSGRVTFELRDVPSGGEWELELQVGDHENYDFTTVQRGEFFDYFQLSETLVLRPDAGLDGRERRPPVIEVTRAPGVETTEADAVVSGVVKDDEGVRDVMVFHGEEKVFYRGGEVGTKALPFSVDPRLDRGTNLVYVLARDQRGLVATLPLGVWLSEAASAEAPSTPAQAVIE